MPNRFVDDMLFEEPIRPMRPMRPGGLSGANPFPTYEQWREEQKAKQGELGSAVAGSEHTPAGPSQDARSSGAGDEPTPSSPMGTGDAGGLGGFDMSSLGLPGTRDPKEGESPDRQPVLPPAGGGGQGGDFTQNDPVTGKPAGPAKDEKDQVGGGFDMSKLGLPGTRDLKEGELSPSAGAPTRPSDGPSAGAGSTTLPEPSIGEETLKHWTELQKILGFEDPLATAKRYEGPRPEPYDITPKSVQGGLGLLAPMIATMINPAFGSAMGQAQYGGMAEKIGERQKQIAEYDKTLASLAEKIKAEQDSTKRSFMVAEYNDIKAQRQARIAEEKNRIAQERNSISRDSLVFRMNAFDETMTYKYFMASQNKELRNRGLDIKQAYQEAVVALRTYEDDLKAGNLDERRKKDALDAIEKANRLAQTGWNSEMHRSNLTAAEAQQASSAIDADIQRTENLIASTSDEQIRGQYEAYLSYLKTAKSFFEKRATEPDAGPGAPGYKPGKSGKAVPKGYNPATGLFSVKDAKGQPQTMSKADIIKILKQAGTPERIRKVIEVMGLDPADWPSNVVQ